MSEYENISEQLSAYLDGELSAEETLRVETALAGDETLSKELEQLRKTRELVRSLPREKAGDDFAAKVMLAATEQGAMPWKPASLPNPWRRYLAAAALVVFAVGLGIFLSITSYDAGPEPTPPSELTLKTPEEMQDFGTIARRLDDLPADGMAKDEAAPPTEPITYADESMKGPATPEPAETEVASPAIMPPSAPPGYAPERAIAKDVSERRGTGGVSGKSGIVAGKKASGSRTARYKSLSHASRKGPGKYDRSSAVLAGPQSMDTLVKLVEPADNEVIYTDNLAMGQKQVEAVLLSNAVQITPPTQRQLQPSEANLYQPSPAANRQVEEKPAPSQQLQYIVYGNPSQLQRVRMQLQTDVRAKQVVAQRPMPLMEQKERIGIGVQSKPTAGEKTLAKAKEKNSTSTERTPEKSSANKQSHLGYTITTQPANQPTTRQLAQIQSTLQTQPAAQQEQQGQLRERLLNNQAMIITLKVHPQAKADIKAKK